ncbi:MAG TPA: DNA polymerase III subunit gamma/tau, partial [Nocardioides sp.]
APSVEQPATAPTVLAPAAAARPDREPEEAAEPDPAPEPAPEPVMRAETEPGHTPAPAPELKDAPAVGALSLVEVRRLWPDIVEATKMRRRVAWMHLTQNSQVIGVDGRTLTLGFTNVGARDSFVNGGCDEILRQAAIDVAGVDWKVEAIVDPSAGGGRTEPGSAPAPAPAVPSTAAPAFASEPSGAPDWEGDAGEDPAPESGPTAQAAPAASSAPEPTRSGDPDSDAHPDDPDAENSGLAGAELLERELGAEVIEEIRHS